MSGKRSDRAPQRAYIKAVAYHLPSQTLDNEELARTHPEWDAPKIESKTGIFSRAIAANGECASDLGVRAAERLFATYVCHPSDIDFLLFCTQSPDYFLPATACTMQSRLGLDTRCGALDINQGCSGFVYGLSLAKGLVESGSAENVLLITADTYSKFLAPDDQGTRAIFGDGAAATLVSATPHEQEWIGPFVFGTDGSGAGNLIVRAGGMRDREGARAADRHLYMNGPEIFNFTIRTLPTACSELLANAGMACSEVDYFIFHQANQFMLEHLRKKMSIPVEKFCINLRNCGNTVSSTIPMAMQQALVNKEIRPGNRVMVVGFGVGYSWAAAMLRIL